MPSKTAPDYGKRPAGRNRRNGDEEGLGAHLAKSSKFQTPEKLQASSSKRGPRFGAWNLGFLWCLELGFWCFASGISLELGVWCLVFRSTAAQKPRCGAPVLRLLRRVTGTWQSLIVERDLIAVYVLPIEISSRTQS